MAARSDERTVASNSTFARASVAPQTSQTGDVGGWAATLATPSSPHATYDGVRSALQITSSLFGAFEVGYRLAEALRHDTESV